MNIQPITPTSITRILPPSDTPLLHAALDARAEGCDLYSNGKSIIASPVRMPGWIRVGVSVKEKVRE